MNILSLSLLVAVYFLAISDIAEGQAVPRCELTSPQAQGETRNEVPSHGSRAQERLRPQQRNRFASQHQPSVKEQPHFQQPLEEPHHQPSAKEQPLEVPHHQPSVQEQPLEEPHIQLSVQEQPHFQQPLEESHHQPAVQVELRFQQPDQPTFEHHAPRHENRQRQAFQQPRQPSHVPDRRPVHRQRPQQRRQQAVQQRQPQTHQAGGSQHDALLSRYGYEQLGNGKHALVVTGYGTWQQALADCESQIPGATLFMASSPEDSAWLGQRINFEKDRVNGASKFWVGLISRGPNGPLQWLDGTRYRTYQEVVQVSGYDDSTKSFAWAVPDSFSRLKYEFLTVDDEAESHICQYEIV